MSHESLSGEAYVLRTRMQKPATYEVILAASGDLKGYVKGSLGETNSLNFARVLLSNNLTPEERVDLGRHVQEKSKDLLSINPHDRVAKSALRFGRRVEAEARRDQDLFLRFHS